MLTRAKDRFQFIFNKAASIAHAIGLTPNSASSIGFLLALASAGFYIWKSLLLAVTFLLLSGFFDALDGALAKAYGRTTKFGSFLDSTLDRLSDAVILCGIIVAGYCGLAWGLAALVGCLLVSYARAKAESVDIQMAGVGLAERAERILILSTATALALVWVDALEIGVALIAILCFITVLERSLRVYRAGKS